MKVIFVKTNSGIDIEVKKALIGYNIYDCGQFESWSLTLSGAKKRVKYLSTTGY